MTKTRVGVLRGGPSSEYEVSLNSGGAVLENLPKERYDARELFVDRAGTWHMRGLPMEPARALAQVDVVFNALHGSYGEDGQVQRLLDTHGVRYTGSRALASALSMNKVLAKQRLGHLDFAATPHLVIERDDAVPDYLVHVFQTFPQPSVVKPIGGGSSVGVSIALSYVAFVDAIERALREHERVLVEEYITGREATVGVIDDYRDEAYYVLPPIEIIPTKSNFFDYDEKYAGFAREVCPGDFTHEETDELMRLAREVHRALGLRHYSRSDFILSRRGIHFLEVNALPGLTTESLIPKAVQAVGATFPSFLDHLVTLALNEK